jgi:hypothetical protein
MNQTEMTGWCRNLFWQLPLLALVSYLAYLSSSQVSELMPETIVDASSYNERESGYKAMFELCRKVGLDCRRFEGSYRELVSGKAVLLVVAPSNPLSAHEIEKVLKWVEKGNDLVYLDYFMYGSAQQFLERLGLKAQPSVSRTDFILPAPASPPEMQHVGRFSLSCESRLFGGQAILPDEGGALMVQVKHGRGRCLVATLPGLCSNRKIGDKDSRGNFQFLVNWLTASRGQVLFDERAHGYTSCQNLFVYLARGPVGLVVLQIAAIFCLALASLNQRFGPARRLSVRRKIALSEFVDGMASTYLKARAYDAAFSILYGSFRTRLLKALSLAAQEETEEIARAWSRSTSLSYEETFNFLKLADELQAQKKISEERLLSTMKECDRLYCESKTDLSVGRRLRKG